MASWAACSIFGGPSSSEALSHDRADTGGQREAFRGTCGRIRPQPYHHGGRAYRATMRAAATLPKLRLAGGPVGVPVRDLVLKKDPNLAVEFVEQEIVCPKKPSSTRPIRTRAKQAKNGSLHEIKPLSGRPG